jgi:hypothetical protein
MVRRLVLLACVSACGLFPDLGALTSDAGGGSDATSDVTTPSDATPADVTKDVTLLDAPPSDAGLDVKTSPCTAKHTFCDDFDKGTLGATWDYTNNGGGGTLSQTTSSVTAPYALQAQVPGGGGHPYAMLQKYFPASAHVHFECDIMIVGSQSSQMEIDYFDFAFVPTGYTYGDFNLERLNPGGTSEEISKANGADADIYNDDDITEELTSWKHLVADVDYTKSTFTVVVDGVTIDAMSMTPPLVSAQSTMGVGITYAASLSATWSVLVDNVVVDLQ